jgi:hypothetical protein
VMALEALMRIERTDAAPRRTAACQSRSKLELILGRWLKLKMVNEIRPRNEEVNLLTKRAQCYT